MRATLQPIQTTTQLILLGQRAAEDDHVVIHPTHLIEKEGEIVGYVSAGAVSMLNCWVHSQKVNKFESFRLLTEAEQLMAAQGHRVICLPCAHTSPFRPYIERRGYTHLGQSGFNLKRM